MEARVKKSRKLVCIIGLLVLFALGDFGRAASQPIPSKPFAPILHQLLQTPHLHAAVDSTPPEPAPELQTPERKRKASFLAAAGLIVLSLLILASGLALLHAFRRR
jgi:hypothetical protein